LLDFDGEDVVIELRLKEAKRLAESSNHVAVKGKPMPMETFAMDASSSANEVKISPSTPEYL
jgi:hypothetical protein